jgi:hypothetical protein
MDKRITDRNGRTLGFIKDSGAGKIVTDANGQIKGRYEARNDKTFTNIGTYTGPGDQLLRLLEKD